MNRGGVHYSVTPLTPVVKWLLIANVGIWLVLQVIVEGMILDTPWITAIFGLIPAGVINQFRVWQLFSYMFLHAAGDVFHILFNMLLLWMLGGELEQRWGSRFFLIYYLVSGVGAAFIYVFSVLIYALITGSTAVWASPVVGASGAIFGILLAYGVIFGERIMYFMMLFPMPAKWFVVVCGVVEAVTLLNVGIGGGRVANLAHLGGLASGFLFLKFYTRFQQQRWRKQSSKRGRGLRLVVNNDRKDDDGQDGPRYWN